MNSRSAACWYRAAALARAGGDEDDHAQTLVPFDWRTREETEAVLALARAWRQPPAILRALDAVTRDLQHRRGAYREAIERFEEFLAVARRYGSIPGQAEALVQLSNLHGELGDFALARRLESQAREMVDRLGAGHRLHLVLGTAVASLQHDRDEDWMALADGAMRFAGGPAAHRSPIGLLVAAIAAYDFSRAGDAGRARRVLEALTALLARMEPTMYQQNLCTSVGAAVVWDRQERDLAPTYRRLALDLIAAGVGDPVFGCNALVVARMAALLGDGAEAAAYFRAARAAADAQGRRPLRAIVDYDEALALLRAGGGGRGAGTDAGRVKALLEAALAAFRLLGMGEMWAERAEGALGRLRAAPATEPPRPAAAAGLPPGGAAAGLTAREAEVRRHAAAGDTNRQIAAALVISEKTVGHHLASVYAKLGVASRAAATAAALRRGLA